jgi:hypothetical protein
MFLEPGVKNINQNNLVAPTGFEPEYKVCGTFQARGYFILRKLHELDPAKLNTVLVKLFRNQEKEPHDITKVEWQVILEYVGARPEEIKAVQVKMGRWQSSPRGRKGK